MQFFPKTNPNVVAITGTWDPPLPRHIEVLKRLVRYSRKTGLMPCVLVFHPSPANISSENKYKEYFDLDTKLALLAHLGINNPVVVEFTAETLLLGVVDFLDWFHKSTGLVLKELWVGENQRMGVGTQGFDTIGIECAARNIKVRRLKDSYRVDLDKEDVSANFKQGKFHLTKAAIGYYPTFKLNADQRVNIHNGLYHAKLRTDPFSDAGELPITVHITEGHMQASEYPDKYKWLILLERVEE